MLGVKYEPEGMGLEVSLDYKTQQTKQQQIPLHILVKLCRVEDREEKG